MSRTLSRHEESRPLIAIVTPVYNGGRYLAETMACVQAQTYGPLVHVVLDNASTDDTAEIIRRFEGGRVPLIHSRNPVTVPACQNWNAAWRLVPPEAEWFRLLCADDLMVPDAIERKAALALANPQIGMVGCCYATPGGVCGSDLPKDRVVYSGSEILKLYLQRETMALSGMFTLIKCDLARMYDPLYDESIVGHDTDTNLKILKQTDYGFIHEELVTWRQHDGTITRSLDDADLVIKAEWMVLLDRYGPSTMGIEGYRKSRLAFRRHYLRKLFKLLFQSRHDLFRKHMADLKRRGNHATPADFADALWNWVVLASLSRRSQVGRAV